MPNSPAWNNWDSPRRQPADPSNVDSLWNFDQRQSFPWLDDNDNYNLWDNFDLTLAPINSGSVLDNLPPLSPALLDAPSRLSASSEDPFMNEPPPAQDYRPPPSNQQAQVRREPSPVHSQSFFAGINSPDPFEEFSNLTPPPPNMPPSNHTRSSSFVDLTSSSPVQSRLDGPPNKKRKAETQGRGRASKSGKTILSLSPDPEDVECVNLEDVETQQEYEDMKARQQAEAIKAQNQADASKPIRLAEFKCIICMDDPTDLTVTHCGMYLSRPKVYASALLTYIGHLFCSECLFQALHAGERKSCPVCRTQIVVPRAGQKPTSKAYFPLSLKLTTAKKQGKRPIRA